MKKLFLLVMLSLCTNVLVCQEQRQPICTEENSAYCDEMIDFLLDFLNQASYQLNAKMVQEGLTNTNSESYHLLIQKIVNEYNDVKEMIFHQLSALVGQESAQMLFEEMYLYQQHALDEKNTPSSWQAFIKENGTILFKEIDEKSITGTSKKIVYNKLKQDFGHNSEIELLREKSKKVYRKK